MQHGGIPSPSTPLNPSHYQTSNVYLAAFLLSQGMLFDGFERASKRRVLFRFVADARLHELLRLYWCNAATPLAAADLFSCLRRLKSTVRRKPAQHAAPLHIASALPASPHSR